MIYVKIENKIVTDSIVLPDGEDVTFIREVLGLDGLWVASDTGRVGDIYENGEFTPPIEPEPEPIIPRAITRRQGRLALLEVGKLDTVEAAVESAGRAAQVEYEADTWERSNAFLQAMWAQLGGTESELDDLFTLAATL